MDLDRDRRRRLRRCFPRTRGDGPVMWIESRSIYRFPPHARGWTALLNGLAHLLDVSPARAGMDPHNKQRDSENVSFPRTRGDGPALPSARPPVNVFPPHARGWTLSELIVAVAAAVSPARAGMDRPRSPAAWSRISFPRTRGDGPEGRIPSLYTF